MAEGQAPQGDVKIVAGPPTDELHSDDELSVQVRFPGTGRRSSRSAD